ncbi:GNAT family N-acetyltransferase [Acinetobacter piscicola]|uniref:GNAT family N-acetyltransferase n=1 Tax=Acinetobacter piscicola TaxID=2006115 RepID=UPI0010222A11|nr:GNAT family N-acetyltransferase [Acinetobacter piscicola]RYL27610.1 GNAT family N-acetyltransferase [Acinetobacter piscicola]
MDIKIRSLNISQDIEAIRKLSIQLGYPNQDNLADRLAMIQNDENYITLVAEYNNQVIAYIGFIRFRSWELDGEFIRIQTFVVDEKYRSQGIGKLLLNAVEDFAKQNQISRVLLNSANHEGRLIAHQFYKNQGYDAKSTGFFKVIEL